MFFFFHIFQSVHLGRALDTFFVCINAQFRITPVESGTRRSDRRAARRPSPRDQNELVPPVHGGPLSWGSRGTNIKHYVIIIIIRRQPPSDHPPRGLLTARGLPTTAGRQMGGDDQ